MSLLCKVGGSGVMIFLKIGITALVLFSAIVFIGKHLDSPSEIEARILNLSSVFLLAVSTISSTISVWVLL